MIKLNLISVKLNKLCINFFCGVQKEKYRLKAPFEYLKHICQVGEEVFYREFENLGPTDLHSTKQEVGSEMED